MAFPRESGTLAVRLAARSNTGRWQVMLTEEACDPTAKMLAARHGLSQREGEILFWIGQGKTNEEIGIILSISTRTVQKHTERVFAKMGLDNRTAAARVAMGK